MKPVNPDQIPEIWGEIRETLLRALDRPECGWTERSVLAGTLSGEMHLWRFDGTVLVTRFVEYPKHKFCELLFLAGGDMESWLPYESVIALWAGVNGCKALSIHGRDGWERITGWTKIHSVLRRNI